MKNLLILFIALFVCQFAHAQKYQQIKRPHNLKKVTVNPRLIKPVILKPDLVVVNNINLVHSNGKRYLYAKVKNIGNVRSISNNMQLRISWRVDYESWSNVERFRNFRIPALNPGQQHQVCVLVPDNEIHSNEGFGSNSAAFRFFADQGKAVNELLENNNIKVKYVPILRD